VAERARKGTRLRVPQNSRDLAKRHVGVVQQIARDFEANLVGNLPERQALGVQVPMQGPAVH
jgi:hypothetical protein